MTATSVPPAASTALHNGGSESSSKEFTIKEKSLEKVEVVEEAQAGASNLDEDFPDGGLRAWLVVVGVRPSQLHLRDFASPPRTELVIDYLSGHVQYLRNVSSHTHQLMHPSRILNTFG